MQRLKRLGLLSSVSLQPMEPGGVRRLKRLGLLSSVSLQTGKAGRRMKGCGADRRGGYGTGVCVKNRGEGSNASWKARLGLLSSVSRLGRLHTTTDEAGLTVQRVTSGEERRRW